MNVKFELRYLPLLVNKMFLLKTWNTHVVFCFSIMGIEISHYNSYACSICEVMGTYRINFFLSSHDNTDTPENSEDIKVLISSFRSHVIKLKVSKKPDKMNMDLLSEDDTSSGIWNSITR